jgi:hypothetical protein
MEFITLFICKKLLLINRNPGAYDEKYFTSAAFSLNYGEKETFNSLEEAKKYQLRQGLQIGIYEVKLPSTKANINPQDIRNLYLNPQLQSEPINNKLLSDQQIDSPQERRYDL